MRRLLPPLLACVLLPTLAPADVIYLVDGRTLDDVEIVDELLTGIVYKAKGRSSEETLDPDRVLSIEYKKVPRLIEEAESMAAEGAVLDGIERLSQFVQDVESGENRRDRQPWAPAHALRRIVEMRAGLGDAEGVVQAAETLVSKRPGSRHAPSALLAKSEALLALGKRPSAQAALQALREMVEGQGLSRRWTLELQLAEIAADEALRGQSKRDRLIEIGAQAGDAFPIVRNRARLGEGETWLEGDKPDFVSARKIFDRIIADPKADDETLAGAYTGLGDCLFHAAAEKLKAGADASAELSEAQLAYMRVVVNFHDQPRYVPRAMFYAGRTFELLGGDLARPHARRLYGRVVREFPKSSWASEARNFLK